MYEILEPTWTNWVRIYLNQEVIAIIKRCKENELDLGQVIDEVSPRTKAGTGLDDWYNGTLTILVGLAAFNK